jgi:hypothetical protein
VDALFALEVGQPLRAQSDCLTGAHGDAGTVFATDTKATAPEDDMVCEAGHRLNLAAHEERVLV